MCEDRRTQTPTEEDSSGDEKPSVAGRGTGRQASRIHKVIIALSTTVGTVHWAIEREMLARSWMK